MSKHNKAEIKQKIKKDPDFIHCNKYNNSLKQLLERNADGVSDSIIARVLLLTEDQVEKIYQKAIIKLRKTLDTPEGL